MYLDLTGSRQATQLTEQPECFPQYGVTVDFLPTNEYIEKKKPTIYYHNPWKQTGFLDLATNYISK